jgi:hypothetical protein
MKKQRPIVSNPYAVQKRILAAKPTIVKQLKFWNMGAYPNLMGDENGKPYLVALSKEGYYLGAPKWPNRLYRKYGICTFEKREATSNVCSIGWSEREQKWYGWSHRAIAGFRTKQQAKRFARSVS